MKIHDPWCVTCRSGHRPTAVAGSAVLAAVGILVILLVISGDARRASNAYAQTRPAPVAAPDLLSETGLYRDVATRAVDPAHLVYQPQYPLWSDGAEKRRWIHVPPGTSIDASDPDDWQFPVGTKVWKEFGFGRPVETRYMEHIAPGRWIFATYLWNEEGTEAARASDRGHPRFFEIASGLHHDIPGRYDCLACHEGQPNPVLGFGALQLSSDRDPLAPHQETPGPDSVDLTELVGRGLVRMLPFDPAAHPPRIDAPSPRARAALGYLHANCGGCHNDRGPLAGLGFSLLSRIGDPGRHEATGAGSETSPVLATTVGRPSHFRLPGRAEERLPRIAAGDPARSVLLHRVSSREAAVQMPPLGTHLADSAAVALLTGWIRDDLEPEPVSVVSNLNPTTED